jgi:NADPH-dependent 2,4-dienoyl-CoA reductase/sulfur reductase-like enzyme
VWRGTEELPGVELRLGRRIVSLDPSAAHGTDDQGEEYDYERLLLATGGEPRRLERADGVVYFRTLDDYRGLRERAVPGARMVVIGAGFIGSEIAAALAGTGCHVTMVFPDPAIGSRLLPPGLADFVTEYYRERGVEVIAGETVGSVESVADGARVHTGSGVMLEADAVVAGLGIVPRTELAEAAGLPVENGILVDALGRVAGSETIFAAGDVASFPAAALGRRLRVEHEDHANTHGRVVGANMAGAGLEYDHLPFFYSDLFDLGYEAVGELDSRLETVETWEEPNRKGVVAYVDEQRRPRGFLLWNTWDRVDDARERIRAGEPVGEELLV